MVKCSFDLFQKKKTGLSVVCVCVSACVLGWGNWLDSDALLKSSENGAKWAKMTLFELSRPPQDPCFVVGDDTEATGRFAVLRVSGPEITQKHVHTYTYKWTSSPPSRGMNLTRRNQPNRSPQPKTTVKLPG